ncbi:grasp-with-spasm system ATP-grasp peptide maturase [Taibaiella soli]|uniref:Grasp-with-spasm system ATP-grasp peptide maturase n=1 Tax=Taibaiella soli TaxID=1649169 RepID=A0A2W2BC80_9BACT|nr:grasp-with-spasm system ATP-grasp peptide maturase [Taibaiella soli]PZF73829.1 grasp-with-spasm system ATP-grasp peptide maturase [Taibaiella soli]
MIFIHSDSDENSTDDVMDWLFYLGDREILRLNDAICIEKMTHFIGDSLGNSYIRTSRGEDNLFREIESNWYRRGGYMFSQNSVPASLFEYSTIASAINQYYYKESQQVFDTYYHDLFHRLNGLNRFSDNRINKIEVLSKAFRQGLKIPNTIVTNSYSDLMDFAKEKNAIITKAISNGVVRFMVNEEAEMVFGIGTSKLTYNELVAQSSKYVDDHLAFSVAQEYVEKQIEIRSFYIGGSFFSMAIFSQSNEKTALDYRRYDFERPNRFIPFQLPDDIEVKLHSLMEDMSMNSGSFDIIYTPEKEYVFLEVNPIGQYQWLTKHCNYFIDREIASFLLKFDKEV